MPKIIVTSRYMRNTPKRTASDLVKYMGTREGVEKMPIGIDRSPSTVRQQRLIKEILKTNPTAEKYSEYLDYRKEPTKSNASEFIDAFIERNADRIGDMKQMVSYMAERPGVEKIGPHGLFSQTDDKIDLNSVAETVGSHSGIIWTHVVSLHREDAERLGYNNAQAWKDAVRRNVTEIAEAHNISLNNLQWYAAFHNTAHHPHIHLLVYSKDAKQGWLTKKSIDDLRSAFGNDIFRQEQYKLFTMETELRGKLKEDFKYDLAAMLAHIRNLYEPTVQAEKLFEKLCEQLRSYSGRKQYAYLPTEIKNTVNRIVGEFSKDESIAELYAEWNKANREKLSLYFDKKKPDIPLEDNKEFRSLKNLVIKAAFEVLQNESMINARSSLILSPLKSLAMSLARMISQGYVRRRSRLNSQIDGKLKSKIEQKKAAHELKTDQSETELSAEDELKM